MLQPSYHQKSPWPADCCQFWHHPAVASAKTAVFWDYDSQSRKTCSLAALSSNAVYCNGRCQSGRSKSLLLRLYLLVKLFGGVEVAEYSSLTPQQRKAILRDFRSGKVQLLIYSDAMARGMGIQDVSSVISCDVPNFVRGYIHRVGRTARAGNKGTAITLLHSEEVHHFKELIQKTGREKIPKYKIKEDELQSMVDKYQEALKQLQDAFKLEGQKKSQNKGKQQIMTLLQEQLMKNLRK